MQEGGPGAGLAPDHVVKLWRFSPIHLVVLSGMHAWSKLGVREKTGAQQATVGHRTGDTSGWQAGMHVYARGSEGSTCSTATVGPASNSGSVAAVAAAEHERAGHGMPGPVVRQLACERSTGILGSWLPAPPPIGCRGSEINWIDWRAAARRHTVVRR